MIIQKSNILSRQHFQKHNLKAKLSIFDSTLSESDNMFMNGYRRLWDAGHYRFIWKPKPLPRRDDERRLLL